MVQFFHRQRLVQRWPLRRLPHANALRESDLGNGCGSKALAAVVTLDQHMLGTAVRRELGPILPKSSREVETLGGFASQPYYPMQPLGCSIAALHRQLNQPHQQCQLSYHRDPRALHKALKFVMPTLQMFP